MKSLLLPPPCAPLVCALSDSAPPPLVDGGMSPLRKRVRRSRASGLVFALAVLLPFVALPTARAFSISLQPSSQTIGVGGNTTLDVVVSGLGDHTSPSLGAFVFWFTYDNSILLANSVSFGSYLDLGSFVPPSQDFDLTSPGLIYLSETSLESSADLNAAQPSSFTLATIGFQGWAAGASAIELDLASSSLSDEFGTSSLPFDFTGANITVPDGGATGSLLALALLGLWVIRTRAACYDSSTRSM